MLYQKRMYNYVCPCSYSRYSYQPALTFPFFSLCAGKSGGNKEEGEKKEGGEWEQYNAGAAFLGPTLWDKTITYDSDLKVSIELLLLPVCMEGGWEGVCEGESGVI